MIAGLEPYASYKPSGVEWLGDVPASWGIRKLRGILRRVNERGRPDLPLLSVVRERGVILRDRTNQDENRNYIPDDLSNYKVVRVGQFAMNKMKAWQGSYGVSQHEGIVSPAYFVFDLGGVDGRFFHEAIRSRAYVPSFAQASDGVRIGQWDLDEPRMREILFALPPLAEQSAIVRFLDHYDQRIRRYIRARQRLIDLLGEGIQATTETAVSGNGTVYQRLSAVARQTQRPVTRIDSELYTPIGLYNRGRGLFHKPALLGSDLGDSFFYWVHSGDLVISGQFAWEGAVALASEDDAGCVASHRYPILRGLVGIADSAYLWAFLRSQYGQMLLDIHSRGAAGRNRPLNPRTLMKEHIPVPPLALQTEIAALVARKALVERSVAREIALLREYRARLIADVVTGKLDVREAAAKLPYEPEEGALEAEIGEEAELEDDAELPEEDADADD